MNKLNVHHRHYFVWKIRMDEQHLFRHLCPKMYLKHYKGAKNMVNYRIGMLTLIEHEKKKKIMAKARTRCPGSFHFKYIPCCCGLIRFARRRRNCHQNIQHLPYELCIASWLIFAPISYHFKYLINFISGTITFQRYTWFYSCGLVGQLWLTWFHLIDEAKKWRKKPNPHANWSSK